MTHPSTYAEDEAHYNGSVDRADPWDNFDASNYNVNFREYSSNVIAVPEPASFVLIGRGLIALLGVQSRKTTH